MAHTASHTAKQEKKKAETLIGNIKPKEPGGTLNRQQQARVKALEETVRTADIAIRATDAAEDLSAGDALAQRNVHMDERAAAQQALAALQKEGKSAAELTAARQAVFDAGLQAQAFGDQHRLLTGRQMGQGTAYTGPGATIALDAQGRPKLTTADIGGTPAGSVIYDIDPAAYIKRFRPKFQPTQEQIDRAGGPGGWVGGLLQGTEAGYLTPWQQTNFQWMLEDADRGILGDAGDFARLPKDWRSDWRKEEWGDTFNEVTGRWERATDPAVRQAAVENQLGRYNAGLFNPYTGQPVGGTGPEPWPGQDVTFPWNKTDTGGGGGGGGGGDTYTPMAAQDWSGIMPQGVFAGSAVQPTQAMQGLVANQGLQYQPWAMPDNSVAGSPFVSQNVQYNAPLNYNPVVANQDNLNNQNNQNNQNFNYTHPAMNPAMPQMNAWLTANPMTDGRFSTALDWTEQLPKLNLFGNTFDYSTYGGGDELNALDMLADVEK